MSLAASQCRLIMLTRYKSDLEYGMQMISQKRTVLAYQAQESAEKHPELAAKFHTMDKQLEAKMRTLDTQYKVVSQESTSVQKMVDDHAKKDFKYA